MAPIFWIVGGIAAVLIASSKKGGNSYIPMDDFAEREAAREKERREREERNRRKRARLEEAKGDLSRAENRNQRRIASAESTAARSKAHLDELVAIERDINNLLK